MTTATFLLLGASIAVPPVPFADRPPPPFADRDGPLPPAGAVVLRDELGLVPDTLPGLVPTDREGWIAVRTGSAAARDPRVRDAVGRSSFVAHAYVDRAGGLCWPGPAVLVRVRDDADRAAREHALASLADAVSIREYRAVPGLFLASLDARDGDAVLARVAALAAHPAVEFAEPDMSFTGRGSGTWVPNDPGFANCWGHLNAGQSAGWQPGFDMRSTHGWALTQGSPDVKVLVIDVGVDQAHPDIRQLPGRDFTTGATAGIAGGGPGNSCDRHGTPVAGCVSSPGGNGVGTVGSAPGCTSVSARCFVSSQPCSGSWNATYSWTANAIDWAAQNGIRVTNNSNYYGASSSAIEASYAATRAAGMVHFASAGNSGDTAISYPASLPTVNGVGALSPGGQRASFSCFGPEVFVTAPGSSVYAADVSGSGGYSSTDYTWIQGTSFASPYAAGVAALVISVAPELGAAAIEGVLRDSARDLGPAGFDAEFGWGMVQLDRAIIAAVDCPGDLDDDLDVDGADLGILLGDWGSGSGRSDLDGNGSVSGSDLGLLLGEWGPCT